MATYGKKKSLLPPFGAFRGSNRSSDARGNPIAQDPRSASFAALPRPSYHSAGMTLHDDSIDDLASQILSDDSTFNLPLAPSVYRNPRHSMTMPHLPTLPSKPRQSSSAFGTDPLTNVPGSSGYNHLLDESTDPLNDSSGDFALRREHTSGRELPPLIPRRSSKRKSRKHKRHFRRLIGGNSAPPAPATRPVISNPVLESSTSSVLQDGRLIDLPTRHRDYNPDSIIVNPTTTRTLGYVQRCVSTEFSSTEISGPPANNLTSATTVGNARGGLFTGSSPMQVTGVPGPTTKHLSSTALDSAHRDTATRSNARQISGPVNRRKISGPVNARHISGPAVNSSTSVSTATNNGVQPAPSASGESQVAMPHGTGNFGRDIPVQITSMLAHTSALKGPPLPEKPKEEAGKNLFQKAKAAIGFFGKKRNGFNPPVDSRNVNPHDSRYIDPGIVWKEDDISWEDADSQVPRVEKSLNEAQSLAIPKVAARCGAVIKRKPVAQDGRSIRTKKSFNTEERSSSDPFSDAQQLRGYSRDGDSFRSPNDNLIATTHNDISHGSFINEDVSMTSDDNSSRGVTGKEMLKARDNNTVGGAFGNQDTTSSSSSEEIPQLPARAQHLREEFPSARHLYFKSDMDDMLLTSSPVAQSTPRNRLLPSFASDGTTQLGNVSANSRSLFDANNSGMESHTHRDISTIASQLSPDAGLNNHGKRASSTAQEQSSRRLEPRAPVVPSRKRAKNYPSPNKQVLETLESALNEFPFFKPKPRQKYVASTAISSSTPIISLESHSPRTPFLSARSSIPDLETKPSIKKHSNSSLSGTSPLTSTNTYSLNSDKQRVGRSTSMQSMADTGSSRNNDKFIVNLSSQNLGPPAHNQRLASSVTTQYLNSYSMNTGTQGFGRSMSGMIEKDGSRYINHHYPLSTDAQGFVRSVKNVDMMTTPEYGLGSSAGHHSVSTSSDTRRFGGILNRKDANTKITNSPFPTTTSGDTLRDRAVDSSKDKLSEEAEDRDVSRNFGRLHLGQPTSVSGDTFRRHKKPFVSRPIAEHTGRNGYRLRSNDVRQGSRLDVESSLLDMDELQMG